MSSSLSVSFIGALQAALSVLLTLFYGVLGARFGLIKESSAKDVSKLCVQMFLPLLIITNVGNQIEADTIGRYVPIMAWSLVYTFLSIGYGAALVKFFNMPAWVAPAVSFNNTTSLPLLLVQSLAVTGLLDDIAGGNVDEAVERAKSYFLINSMLSNGLTFALGPKLIAEEDDDDDEKDDSSDDEDYDREPQNDEEATLRANERTSLIPGRIRKPASKATNKVSQQLDRVYNAMPRPVQRGLSFTYSLINAPLIGAFFAVLVGIIPPVHRAMFNDMQNGGWLKAWFTSSIKNVGELFTALQMFVVGTKLNTSLVQQKNGTEDEVEGETRVPKRALAGIWLARFILWPIASIATIYFLAKKGWLSDDPIQWFAMMLMPCGPPAIILSSLAELKGKEHMKLQVAKLLMISYTVSPIVCFAVVGALKATQKLQSEK